MGDNTSIQDGTIIRTASARLSGGGGGGSRDTSIGSGVSVGHGVSMHAATVGDGALIGTSATLLEGCTASPRPTACPLCRGRSTECLWWMLSSASAHPVHCSVHCRRAADLHVVPLRMET